MKRIILGLFILLSACKSEFPDVPKGIIPMDKMELILADMHITDAVAETRAQMGMNEKLLAQEFHDTWERMPSNILGVPVFALLIWLHAPLWRYFADLIRSLAEDLHRRIVTAAIITVSFAYLIMFAIVFDYSRWISNWAVCMFLILHAVKTLPSSKPVPPISADDTKTGVLGWIVTVIPRVGIIRPF